MIFRRFCFFVATLLVPSAFVWAGPFRVCSNDEVIKLNQRLAGQVLDFTYNHGVDRRICSKALESKRDLYIYLPPQYNPKLQYPLLMWLHGFGQDEKNFLDNVHLFDKAISQGQLPPLIIVAPDGSIQGRPSLFNAGSFYLNTKAGRFEDWIQHDVWDFVHHHFSIRPEREAHIIAGGSMGGFGAFNHAFKYRERYKIVMGFLPPLNLRFRDCHNRHFGDFDPNCFNWEDKIRPRQVVAVFYGFIPILERRLSDPLYGRRGDVVQQIAKDNPVEMLETFSVKPGDYDMWVGYGGRDEFNIDAQIESFLYLASLRKISVNAVKDPKGKHESQTGINLFPYAVQWLGPRIMPYGPIPNPNKSTSQSLGR